MEVRLKEVETSIDRLRSLYEQYYRGIEKLAPTVLQKKVERNLREMRKERIRNTAHRFRLQTQIQKYTTYLTYWQRIERMLEMGQIKRGASGFLVMASQRRREEAGKLDVPEPPCGIEPLILDIDIEEEES